MDCANILHGSVPEWTKGAGCKPAGVRLRGFESYPAHHRSTALSRTVLFHMEELFHMEDRCSVKKERVRAHASRAASTL